MADGGSVPRPRRVLVAENEHLVAVSLCNDLEKLGYTIVGPVPNGRAAVDLAQRETPDLALLDVRMPEMDGLEAGRIIDETVGAPVIIVSAHSDREHVAASVRLGVLGYLLKPVTRDDLRVTLEVAWAQHLNQCKLRDEVGDLTQKLEHRKLVERAKGLLMQHQGLAEPDAMRRLQKQARAGRQSLVSVAQLVIDAYSGAWPRSDDGARR